MTIDPRALVEDATLDFTLGDSASALQKLDTALQADPACAEAWLAKAEVHFESRQFDEALTAGQEAARLHPDDVHVHTTLSRIWVERGDKEKAEEHGAQARMLGWKEQLKEPPST